MKTKLLIIFLIISFYSASAQTTLYLVSKIEAKATNFNEANGLLYKDCDKTISFTIANYSDVPVTRAVKLYLANFDGTSSIDVVWSDEITISAEDHKTINFTNNVNTDNKLYKLILKGKAGTVENMTFDNSSVIPSDNFCSDCDNPLIIRITTDPTGNCNQSTSNPANLYLSSTSEFDNTFNNNSQSYTIRVNNSGDETLYWNSSSIPSWATVENASNVTGESYQTVTISVDANNTMNLRTDEIKFYNTDNSSDYEYLSISQDGASVETCSNPTNLNIYAITETTAHLDWDGTSGATYSFNYRKKGTATWATKTAYSSGILTMDLINGTTYEWKVRTNCSNGVSSNYVYGSDFTPQSTTTNYLINSTSNPSNEGSTDGDGNIQSGNSCTVTASPHSGYTFNYWSENGTVISYSASYTFTVTCNRNLVANFSQTTTTNYSIITFSNPSVGGGTSGGGIKQSGNSCTVTASPHSGYTFNYWSENGTVVSYNASYSFSVTEDRNLVAHFIQNVSPTRIISLSENLNFGNIRTNESIDKYIRITNNGNSTLSIASISCPVGFSGNWSGNIGAGNYKDVEITFAPTQIKYYSGTLAVNSNKTSGTNTIKVYGNGVNTAPVVSNLKFYQEGNQIKFSFFVTDKDALKTCKIYIGKYGDNFTNNQQVINLLGGVSSIESGQQEHIASVNDHATLFNKDGQYEFKVEAVDIYGNKATVEKKTFYYTHYNYTTNPPNAPNYFSVIDADATTGVIKMSWTGVSEADDYYIYRNDKYLGKTSNTSYTDYITSPGEYSFTYHIKSHNSNGPSEASQTASASLVILDNDTPVKNVNITISVKTQTGVPISGVLVEYFNYPLDIRAYSDNSGLIRITLPKGTELILESIIKDGWSFEYDFPDIAFKANHNFTYMVTGTKKEDNDNSGSGEIEALKSNIIAVVDKLPYSDESFKLLMVDNNIQNLEKENDYVFKFKINMAKGYCQTLPNCNMDYRLIFYDEDDNQTAILTQFEIESWVDGIIKFTIDFNNSVYENGYYINPPSGKYKIRLLYKKDTENSYNTAKWEVSYIEYDYLKCNIDISSENNEDYGNLSNGEKATNILDLMYNASLVWEYHGDSGKDAINYLKTLSSGDRSWTKDIKVVEKMFGIDYYKKYKTIKGICNDFIDIKEMYDYTNPTPAAEMRIGLNMLSKLTRYAKLYPLYGSLLAKEIELGDILIQRLDEITSDLQDKSSGILLAQDKIKLFVKIRKPKTLFSNQKYFKNTDIIAHISSAKLIIMNKKQPYDVVLDFQENTNNEDVVEFAVSEKNNPDIDIPIVLKVEFSVIEKGFTRLFSMAIPVNSDYFTGGYSNSLTLVLRTEDFRIMEVLPTKIL